ncbi:hypothetical protein [Streptomyces endocoffeicus]|uniref:hypothetical protein n=1 Tax=Streptomyces endocoffeicus TaxID=2898945 RepID=UPI001E44342D|nr:hypothetical protein [Streptomyces endocoffeicus]
MAGQLVHPAPEKSMWMRGSPPMVVSDQRVLIRPCRAGCLPGLPVDAEVGRGVAAAVQGWSA